MQRLFSILLSILMLIGVGACTDETPVSEKDPTGAALAADEFGASSQLQAEPTESSVHWLSDLSDVDGATAQLVRTDSGAAYTFNTTGLEKGHVVTMWWVIFNNPEECDNPIPAINSACGLPDLFDPAVQASVMGGNGHLVGKSGTASLSGHLREGEIITYHPAFEGTPGLLDAEGAEIHLLLRTHGPAIPGLIDEMRSSFEVGCTPESSGGFGNGPNTCADIQAAAFAALE